MCARSVILPTRSGQVIDGGLLDSGLRLERRRVPLGVVGVIYERVRTLRR